MVGLWFWIFKSFFPVKFRVRNHLLLKMNSPKLNIIKLSEPNCFSFCLGSLHYGVNSFKKPPTNKSFKLQQHFFHSLTTVFAAKNHEAPWKKSQTFRQTYKSYKLKLWKKKLPWSKSRYLVWEVFLLIFFFLLKDVFFLFWYKRKYNVSAYLHVTPVVILA